MTQLDLHKEKNKAPYVMNRSWIYLLPMIALHLGLSLDQMVNLRSCFLYTEDFPELEDKVNLLFKADQTREYINFEEKLSDTICFNHRYEPDKYHTMYIYDIPDEYKQEYKKFKDSKYSEFTDNYKKSIIKFHQYSDKTPRDNGYSVINLLYKKEAAYLAQEKIINEGLPSSSWITIPRDQEIGKQWNETPEGIKLETYLKSMKASELFDKTRFI